MTGLRHLAMSRETRARFEQLLDQSSQLGLDGEMVMAAGPVALRALLALKNATESTSATSRERYVAHVQDALRILEHRKTPELVQQFQARLLALTGRGDDTEVAHVARGEIVVPIPLQSPDVLDALKKAAEPYGVPLDMLRVGTALNSINPATGAPEFGMLDWISGLFDKDGPAPQLPSPGSATDIAPSSKPSDFDPNGPGEFGAALRHPIAAFRALGIRDKAYRSAIDNFERDTLVNGVGDAYRHALASGMLANAVGPEIAKKFTDAHERSFPNEDSARAMDIMNNQIGRSLATGDDDADQLRILEAARKGQLKTLR